MLSAEAETVGLYANVGLHHRRALDVLADMSLNGVAHSADRAALVRLEHLAYRYCK